MMFRCLQLGHMSFCDVLFESKVSAPRGRKCKIKNHIV